MKASGARARYILSALAALAIIQLMWWAYLIIHQQFDIATLLNTIEATAKASDYQTMIVSEFLFFAGVFSLGIWYVLKSNLLQARNEKERTDFMSAVTHELKTPISNIRLSLDTLQRPNLNEESRKKYLHRAQEATNRLLDEVEGILNFHELKEKSFPPVKVSVVELLQDCLAEFEKTQNLQIEWVTKEKGKDWVFVPFQQGRLIVKNLVENAIKYSVAAGKSPVVLKISVYCKDDRCISEIQDFGMGIRASDLKQVFEPFWRSERTKELAINGTGLGLSLSKELAQKYNIQLSLTSAGENQGALAKVAWPLYKA